MLAWQPFPHRVFRDVHEALSWLVPVTAGATAMIVTGVDAPGSTRAVALCEAAPTTQYAFARD